MWAFKRRFARLSTTLSVTTTINNSYGRLGTATRSALVCPGGLFFEFTPPNSKRYQSVFNFFFQKMRRSFLGRYRKAHKNQVVSFLYLRKKHEGRAKSDPPPSQVLVNLHIVGPLDFPSRNGEKPLPSLPLKFVVRSKKKTWKLISCYESISIFFGKASIEVTRDDQRSYLTGRKVSPEMCHYLWTIICRRHWKKHATVLELLFWWGFGRIDPPTSLD